MAKKRRPRVPEVLRRAFGDRARTLGDVILSLSSKSRTKQGVCLCRGRGCVSCEGAAFLLRKDDESGYRRLLDSCFCIVCPTAPELIDFCYRGEWTQRQIARFVMESLIGSSHPRDNIVRFVMESLIGSSHPRDNVLSEGYDKRSHGNINGEFLCDHAWNLLLTRIGESAMSFLLKYSSIFIPLPTNNHHQVTGLLLNNVLQTLDLSRDPEMSILPSKDLLRETHNDDTGVCASSAAEVFCRAKKRKRLYSWQRHRICKRKVDFNSGSDSHFIESRQSSSRFPKGEPVSRSESTDITMKISCASVMQKYKWKTQSSTYLAERNLLNEEVMERRAFNVEHNAMHLNANMASACSNCLMMNSIPTMSVRNQIWKRHLFYNSGSSSSIFSGNHILNRLKPNDSGAHALLHHIFNLSEESFETYHAFCSCINSHFPPASGCLYHSLLRILKTLIRNSRKCQYKELLRKHCSVLSFLASNDTVGQISEVTTIADKKAVAAKKNVYAEKNADHQKQANFVSSRIKSYCEPNMVVSFIWAATRSIVPVDLLGDHSSWRALRANVSKFVKLHRFEMFSLGQCLDRLQTSKLPFLSKIPNQPLCSCLKSNGDRISMKQRLLRLWIYWYFSEMVVPILGTHFYATETEFRKRQTLYYPKPLWNDMLAKTLTSLKKQNYRPIDSEYFAEVTSSRAFGFSRVRFLPKEKGMRLLANLRAPSKAWLPLNGGKVAHFRSVNSALHDVHAVLKRIKVDHPQMLGASVFDYNDVYQLLHQFLSKLKNGSTQMPEVFIVVADVAKAFDSIDQDRLLDVMKDVILKDEYLLKKYAQIVCKKKIMFTRYGYVCVDHDIASALTSIRSSSSHGIITDQGIIRRVNRADIHDLLHEHVKNNILRLGGEFCVQKSGISQGSLISSLLCSFYFGHMERNIIFPVLQKIPNSADVTEDFSCPHPHYTLLRLIDDFLFISTSKAQASAFFNRIRRGFREYNCYMNREKFGLNFDLHGQRKLKSNRRYVGADGVPFLPWSGLLVNCLTLEIQADYTRYIGNHLRSTITVRAHAEVEEHLREKLCNYMRPKCHPLFYDSNINSPAIVRLNLYQAFLLCAMKFHTYFCALPGCPLAPSHCLRIIEESFRYMHRLIKKRMYGIGRRKMEAEPVLRLKKAETLWLGLSAYIRALRKKQTRHKELLTLLASALRQRGPPPCNPSHLSYAVDDSHSSLFWQIKF